MTGSRGTFAEILCTCIEWEPGRPEAAWFRCASCRALVAESAKPGIVAAGRWRATRPDANGHAGFRLNALVSLLANASLNTPQVNPPPNQPQLVTPLGRPLGTNFGDRLAVGMFLGRD